MMATDTAAPPAPRGSRPKLRPFYATVVIFCLLAASTFFVRSKGIDTRYSHDAASGDVQAWLARRRLESEDCREVHQATDQCAFVLQACGDDEAGLLPYLRFFYCTMGAVQPVGFAVLVVWLGLLFTTIGIAASDFFSVNLSTIASILGLSESLAGVTFLAFGNGSPDVFSTFAAMGSNSASMAVGELVGAASFITAVVAGSMALVREFRVGRKTYVRDICFFIVAVVFTMMFLADGHLHLWECLVMIGYYIFYVVTVVGWHWFSTRRRRRREREVAARSHVYGTSRAASEELAPEPYRDDPDEDMDRTVSARGAAASSGDISVLDATPRIEIQGESGEVNDDEEVDEVASNLHLAAEMTSSMRVLRPRFGRSNSTISPIRPSLVGALEFRSALAQLQKERNLSLAALPSRAQFDALLEATRDTHRSQTVAALHAPKTRRTIDIVQGAGSKRDRALSSGDIPEHRNSLTERYASVVDDARREDNVESARAEDQGNRTSSLLSPMRAAGVSDAQLDQLGSHDSLTVPGQRPLSPRNLHLMIPGAAASGSTGSSPISPFPQLTDSPMTLSPHPNAGTGDLFPPPVLARREGSFPIFTEPDYSPKPVRWWPYTLLPPPHVLLGTFFPTLQGWAEKTIWDKIVSTVCVPSIFLLVITLPVVETETGEDAESDASTLPAGVGSLAPPAVSVEPGAEIEPESEWHLYRRRTQSLSHRSPTFASSPVLFPADTPDGGPASAPTLPPPAAPLSSGPAKPVTLTLSDDVLGETAADLQWNRWLVALQILIGPQFAGFILWANWQEDFDNPGKTLIKMTLYTLLASLVLLAILLLTTDADRRPKYHFLLCFLGFLISIAWISTIAGEVVGVLKAFGIILGISEGLLGLTIFAAGNSVGDLIADITVARLGYPVMALSACFGGPMLNILLGIGIGGAWMIMQSSNSRHTKHPDRPIKHKPYKVAVGGTLLVSAISLLITLMALLVLVPMNRWVLSRKIGYGLIALWSISTIINVAIELTGAWTELA